MVWKSAGRIVVRRQAVQTSTTKRSCVGVVFQQVKGNKGAIFIQDRNEVETDTWLGLLAVIPRSKFGVLPSTEFRDDIGPAAIDLRNFWIGVEYPGDSCLITVIER